MNHKAPGCRERGKRNVGVNERKTVYELRQWGKKSLIFFAKRGAGWRREAMLRQ